MQWWAKSASLVRKGLTDLQKMGVPVAPSVPPSLTISDETPLTVFFVLKASGIIYPFPFQLVKNELCSAGYVQLQVDSPERTVSMNMPMYGVVNKFLCISHHMFSPIFSTNISYFHKITRNKKGPDYLGHR